jgi:importin subunit alpha-6/7
MLTPSEHFHSRYELTNPPARLKNFKNGIDAEEGRRRREETQLSIRKQKKNERLSKRRFEIPMSEPTEVQSVESGKVVMSVNELPALMSVIRNITGPAEKLAEATRHIRRMLSVSVNPPVQEVHCHILYSS